MNRVFGWTAEEPARVTLPPGRALSARKSQNQSGHWPVRSFVLSFPLRRSEAGRPQGSSRPQVARALPSPGHTDVLPKLGTWALGGETSGPAVGQGVQRSWGRTPWHGSEAGPALSRHTPTLGGRMPRSWLPTRCPRAGPWSRVRGGRRTARRRWPCPSRRVDRPAGVCGSPQTDRVAHLPKDAGPWAPSGRRLGLCWPSSCDSRGERGRAPDE